MSQFKTASVVAFSLILFDFYNEIINNKSKQNINRFKIKFTGDIL